MAATSSDAAVRRLGRARWKALHRTGIWVLWVIFLVSYGPRAFGDPFSIPPALAVLAAAGLRLYARADRRGVASPAGRAGPTA